MEECLCCSGLSFEECCQPYLQRKKHAPTPEKLMRSRYTAFALKDLDYILATMRGKALHVFRKTHESTDEVKWEKLVIVAAPEVTPLAEEGFVEFIAYYLHAGSPGTLHEKSRFVKRKECWYYIDGQMLP